MMANLQFGVGILHTGISKLIYKLPVQIRIKIPALIDLIFLTGLDSVNRLTG